MVSKKQLGDGEMVVLAMRQHIKALLVPAVVFLAVCAAVGVGLAVVPAGESRRWLQLGIGVVGLAILAKWVLWPFLSWLSSTYTLTNERLLTKHGVIRQYGRTMPLSRVNDVSFDHGLVDRLLGCGTLVVSSAGEMGQLVLTDVPRVESVQRTIYQLVEAEHDRARADPRAADPRVVEPPRR